MTRSFAELEKDYLGIGVGVSIPTLMPKGSQNLPSGVDWKDPGQVKKYHHDYLVKKNGKNELRGAMKIFNDNRKGKPRMNNCEFTHKKGTPHFPFRIAPRRKNLLSQPPYFSKRVDS